MEYHKYYLEQLYPLQNSFLKFFDDQNQNRFYLTGGTALSRFYYQHRYSEDLDFFSATELKDFRETVSKILDAARQKKIAIEVKDIADIWILAKRLSFSWRDIMDIAGKKSPVDPVEVSKIIKTLPREELKIVKWVFDVNLDEVYSDLQIVAGDILLGRSNTLKDSSH